MPGFLAPRRRRDRDRQRFTTIFKRSQETRVFSIVVVVVEQVRKFRNGNEQDDGIRVSNLIIVDAFT